MIVLALDNELLSETQHFDELYPDLKMLGYGIGTPEPRFNYVEVPGKSGVLDLTSALGPITYTNRQLWFTAREYANPPQHIFKYSGLLNKYHGRSVKIVFDDDMEYYYQGRCLVSTVYHDNNTRDITLEIDADPFKYPVYASDEDWLWDPFNFNTGVIRNYRNLVVSGTRVINVIAYEQPESPRFYVTLNQGQTRMTMQYDGETYYLNNGMNTFPQIVIQSLDVHADIHEFTFTGQGMVSINLSGGIL